MTTTGYCTVEQASSRVSADNTALPAGFTDDLERAVLAASRWIDEYTGRRFWKDDDATTVRQLGADHGRWDRRRGCWILEVPDLVSITTVQLDTGDAGTWTTYTTSDYFTEPLSGVVGGYTGWPIERLVFPSTTLRSTGAYPLAKITGQYGWSAIPDAVEETAIAVAKHIVQRRDLRGGLMDFGAAGLARARAEGLFDLVQRFCRVGGTGLPGFA